MTIKLKSILLMITTLTCFISTGQNLEELGKEKPLKFSGSVNASLNSYHTTRTAPSRDPFFWTLSGSPVLSLYGVTMPFSFVVSQKQQSFRQPFNQFGVSPYYKWLHMHLGYRSMNFSRYSLNGHTFTGVGADADPGNFRLGFMVGRLLKPIPEDILADYPIQPTYKRMGYSFKVGYGKPSNYVDVVLFNGWDVDESISRPLDSALVNPQANLVLGVKSKQMLFKKLLFDFDFGISGWTSNLYAEGLPRTDFPLAGVVGKLLDVNYSTQLLKAGNASLSYRFGKVNLQAKYERVDPDYKSMGAYYFNTDLENYTISPSWSMLNNKMRIMASMGLQRNNLLENKASQNKRRINSIRLNYNISQKFNLSTSYTNFQMNQLRYDIVRRDVIDSLGIVQFSQNFMVNINYNFGGDNHKYSLGLNNSIQAFTQDRRNDIIDNDSRSFSPNISFRYSNKEKKLGISSNLNFNEYKAATINSFNWGYSLSANKRPEKGLFNYNVSMGFYQTYLNGEKGGDTWRVGAGGNMSFKERHSLGLRLNFVNRKSYNGRVEGFSEVLGSVSYGYNF